MKRGFKLISVLAIFAVLMFYACNNNSGEKSEKESNTVEAKKSEHARDAGEGGEGEEDGTQFSKADAFDVAKKGTRLVLKFDEESNAFVGTLENTTDDLIENVRVEVHLSNGIELGPTTPVDIKPGGKVDVKLEATEEEFETWSSHAEVGDSEHNHEGGEGTHSHEGEGEHSHGEEGEHK